jgi:hypothetical protein
MLRLRGRRTRYICMDENRVMFFSGCGACGWEEDERHGYMAKSRYPRCPKCDSENTHTEMEIQGKDVLGEPLLHKTHHRFGKVFIRDSKS